MYSLSLAFPVILKNALRGLSVQSDQRDLDYIMNGSRAAMEMIPHILNPKHAPLPRLRARWITLLMRGEVGRAYVVPVLVNPFNVSAALHESCAHYYIVVACN